MCESIGRGIHSLQNSQREVRESNFLRGQLSRGSLIFRFGQLFAWSLVRDHLTEVGPRV